jgi:hypothetical protein
MAITRSHSTITLVQRGAVRSAGVPRSAMRSHRKKLTGVGASIQVSTLAVVLPLRAVASVFAPKGAPIYLAGKSEGHVTCTAPTMPTVTASGPSTNGGGQFVTGDVNISVDGDGVEEILIPDDGNGDVRG